MHHSDEPVPFILRRLISRQYHIGPDGAVIGSSPAADVSLSRDTGLLDKHVEIKWISGMVSRTSKIVNSCLDCIYYTRDELVSQKGVACETRDKLVS